MPETRKDKLAAWALVTLFVLVMLMLLGTLFFIPSR